MTEQFTDESSKLAAMLDENDRAAKYIDPRDVPVRFSTLKQFARSPAHYWHACQLGGDETLAMRLGSGAHALLFGKPIATWGGKVRNGKAWDAFKAQHDGTTILNQREAAEARDIADAVRSNELAARLLNDVITEQTLHWTWQGRKCRSTPDARSTYTVVELKTTKCADPDRFSRDAMWRHYHAQLAFYLDAVREAGLGAPREAYIVAVESSPPYPVTVLRLTERAIDQGRRMCRLWFEQLLACEAANQWPGYAQSIVDFDVPDPDVEVMFGDGDDE